MFKKWFNENFYYHGSPSKIDAFSYAFIGSGDNFQQEGPGFYFTSNEEDAKKYTKSNGTIHKATLDIKNAVPIGGPVNKKHVQWLIKNAPNLEESLMDWDENPSKAFKLVLKAMLEAGTPHEIFQQIWADLYERHQDGTVSYLKNMKRIGYDGVIIPKHDNIVHVVVFDPNDINIAN